MFRAFICPSSGVQVVCYCIWCSALGVVAEVLRSRCVVLCTVCKIESDLLMIINHNCCIKLVSLVIFIYTYDARSHTHIKEASTIRVIHTKAVLKLAIKWLLVFY
jgi:hypothetical protein